MRGTQGVGLSPTAGSKALVPSRKTAYGDKAKSLAPRTRQRLCYFGAAFAVRRDNFRLQTLGDVLHDVLDGAHLIARWVAALIDGGAQLRRPFPGCLKRPHRRLTNSRETLSVMNAVGENE